MRYAIFPAFTILEAHHLPVAFRPLHLARDGYYTATFRFGIICAWI
jgi:hypothetical protein